MWLARFSINGSFHQPSFVLIKEAWVLVNRLHRSIGIAENTEIWMFHFFENGLLSLLEQLGLCS